MDSKFGNSCYLKYKSKFTLYTKNNMMQINMISDTVTRPTKVMLEAMFSAQVGDDVFQSDPTVNALEAKAAKLCGKEAALFCPSGTMTNQLAIKMHTQPLDEIICDHYSHVYRYETGGYAFNSQVAVNLIHGTYGKITADQIEAVIQPPADWLPTSKLVVLESSTNKGGGNYYLPSEIKPIADLCAAHNLKLHLDGARFFNALVEEEYDILDYLQYFDSVSLCLSKGLGAPVGSVLVGKSEEIKLARKFRKVMGGGMRQAGYLAAAGIYALDHNIERLTIDNQRAKEVGLLLAAQDYVEEVMPVKTNIIIFELANDLEASTFLEQLETFGILASPFGKYSVRFIFHLDITDEMFDQILLVIDQLQF